MENLIYAVGRAISLIFGGFAFMVILFFIPVSGPVLLVIGLVLMFGRDRQVDHGWRNPPQEPAINVHQHIYKTLIVRDQSTSPKTKAAEVAASWKVC